MKFLLFILAFCLVSIKLQAQFSTRLVMDTSTIIQDHFEIYISTPQQYDSSKKYKAVYYLDANLKSGKKLRELLAQPAINYQLSKYIFIGIGHTGNFHQQRRRDFIPAADTVKSGENAADFYNYLKRELLPRIQLAYSVRKDSNSIIGHSFGGLFVFYSLLQNDSVFTNYYALSPSLWVNYYAVYKHNQVDERFLQSKYLYFVAGSKENFNRILQGTEKMKQFLDERHYANLKFEYDVINGKTHNSEVPVALQKILIEKLK